MSKEKEAIEKEISIDKVIEYGIYKTLQCSDCKGKGVIDCDKCDKHECQTCLASGKTYTVNEKDLRQLVYSILKEYKKIKNRTKKPIWCDFTDKAKKIGYKAGGNGEQGRIVGESRCGRYYWVLWDGIKTRYKYLKEDIKILR